VHEKNDFAAISKNLGKYRFENNFGLQKNNYIKISSMMSNAAKFDILAINLRVLNYFGNLNYFQICI